MLSPKLEVHAPRPREKNHAKMSQALQPARVHDVPDSYRQVL